MHVGTGTVFSFAREIPTGVFQKNHLVVRHFPAQVPWLIQKGPCQSTFLTRVAWYKPTYDVRGPLVELKEKREEKGGGNGKEKRERKEEGGRSGKRSRGVW